MIDERILNEFKQHNTSPEYIMLITNIQNGEKICNEESVIISAKQIYTSLDFFLNGIETFLEKNNINPFEMSDYLDSLDEKDLKKIEQYIKGIADYITGGKNLKVVDKDLTIYSNISINNDNLYVGELNGYISSEEVKYEIINSETQSSHYIEVVDTVLQKTIDITFNKENGYENLPKIYITIDEKYENLYRNYSISPTQDNNGRYLGVQITFNNLKNKNSYPPVGIVIIGDKKTKTYDEKGELEPVYHNLTVNLYYTELDEDTHQPNEVPIEGKTILIDELEFISDECGNVKGSFVEGAHSITPPAEIEINGTIYTSNVISVDLNDDMIIGIEMEPNN